MTVTTPSPGTTTRRWRRVLTRASVALGVVLATATVASVAFAVAPEAGAVEPAALTIAEGSDPAATVVAASAPTPSPSPSPTVLSGSMQVVAAPIGHGIVRTDAELVVSVNIDNQTLNPLPTGSVALELGSTALSDRAALSTWLDEGTAGPLTEVATTASAPLESGVSATTGIVIPAEALAGLTPGVYPLRATVTVPGADAAITATTAITVADPDTTAQVGVIVPVTAAPRAEGLLTEAQLADLTSPTGALTAVLDGVESTGATLAIDPAIPASIRVLGTSAPASATEWLNRLIALPNPRFALQFGDADVAAQLQAGLAEPLAAPSLRYAMNAADFTSNADTEPTPTPEPTATATATPTPEPTPTVEPGGPTYPPLEALLDIGPVEHRIFWPVAGTADAGTVNALGALGDPALTLVPSASIAPGTIPARGATPDGGGVLVYDAEVSSALSAASRLGDGVLRGAQLTRATALLAFASTDAGGSPLLVALDRGSVRSGVALGATLSAVTATPGVTTALLSQLADAAPTRVTIAEAGPDTARVDAVTELTASESSLDRFATILDDPNLLTGPERTAILQLLGVGWAATPGDWATALVDHRAATATTLDAVGLLPPSAFQLISPGSNLRFYVRNDLPYPVNVVLYATPDDLRLQVQGQTTVEAAAPRANTRVGVPVEARLGNGDVTVELQLRSRSFVAIGEPQYAEVSVHAEWETIGLIILGVLVVGFLALGVVRTILRRREVRKQRADAEGTGEERDE